METTFFNRFSKDQLQEGYKRSLAGLRICLERSKKNGKYNGKHTDFWSAKVLEYENIIKSM